MRISLWHRYLLAFSVSSKYLSIVLYCRRIEGAADLGNNDVTSERKGEEKNFAQSGFFAFGSKPRLRKYQHQLSALGRD